MAAVSLRGVSKRYGTVEAVHDVDLEIAHGEFVVFVGPSGCGKSTLLRMIAGLEDITSGEIAIDGAVVNDLPPRERDIAMVFQDYALYPNKSVFENMAFGLRLRRVADGEVAQLVRRAADTLQIGHLLDRRPKELSGGQRQRVAMGRAIVREPRVFLFDEPLSNLDALLRNQVRAEIKRLHQRVGGTMVYVTHDQVEAMTLADRIVVLHAGRIAQVGTPDDIYHRPAHRFVAGFTGSPPMNLVDARVDGPDGRWAIALAGGHALVAVGADAARLAAIGRRDVVFGIRPEGMAERGAATPAGRPTLRLPVALIEPLGAENVLHLGLGAIELLARVPAATRPAVGATVDVAFDPAAFRFFDPATGAALG